MPIKLQKQSNFITYRLNYKDILDVNEIEEKVYRILLVSGQLSNGELRVATGLGMTELENSLTKLLKNKLIRQIPGLDGRYSVLLPLSQLPTKLQTISEQYKELSSGLNSALDVSINDIKSDLSTNSEVFLRNVKSKEEEINNLLSNKKNEFHESINTEKVSLTDNFTRINTQIDGSFREIQNQIDENIKEQASVIGKNSNTLKSKLNETNQSFKKQTEELKQGLEQSLPQEPISLSDIKHTILNTISSLNPEINLTLDKISSEIDVQQSVLQSIIQTANSNLIKSGEEYHHSTKQLMEQSISTIESIELQEHQSTENLSNQFKELFTINENEISSFDDILSQKNVSYQSQTQANHTSIMEKQSSITNNLQNTVETISNSLSDLLLNTNENLQENIKSINSSISSTVEKELESIKSSLHEFLSKLINDSSTKFDALQQHIVDQLQENESLLTKNHAESQISVQEGISSSAGSLKTLIDTVTVETKTQISDLITSLNDLVHLNTSEFRKLITELKQKYNLLLQKFTEDLSTHSTKVASELNSGKDSIKQQLLSNDEIFVTKITQASDGINTQLDTQLESIRNSNQESINNIKSMTKESLTKISENLDQKLDETSRSLNNMQETLLTNIRSVIQSLADSFLQLTENNDHINQKHMEEIESTSNELIKNIHDVFLLIQTDQHNSLMNVSTQTQKTVNQLIDTHSSEIDSLIDFLISAEKQSHEGLNGLVLSDQSSQVQSIHNIMKEYAQSYENTTNTIIEKTHDLINIFDALFEVQEKTDTPKTNTTHIIGKKAIKYQMNDLLQRVKSKVTILVPSIDMINIESIRQMKSVIQVTIISHIDEVKDKAWIDEMHDVNANVTLRSIIKSGFGGELPDFIGCERESEEILLGTIDDAAKDYVAIASASEYFVKILGNIVIADYARGKSKQIKK